jgi:peptidylprolyl isomerase domain and WD repeat-containing protein 1
MYEKSFMHRDIVSRLAVADESEFIITCSVDGHIKFWRKTFKLVDFVKHFKAHRGPISGLSVNQDMSLVCSAGSTDHSLKLYDLKSTDLINILKVPFEPSLVEIFP